VEKVSESNLRTVVKRNQNEINWNYAVVERLNKEDKSTALLPFNLGKAISGQDAESNLLLQPGDLITICSQADIQIPMANRSVYVRLEGEFAGAGVYKALPGETLRGLVARMGGFTPNAFLYGIRFERESVRAMQQNKLDNMLDKMEEEIKRNAANKSRGALSAEDAVLSKETAAAQLAAVAKMRAAKASGRVVLEINHQNSGAIEELPELVLEDGDRLVVPPKPVVVGVLGMVYNENTFLFKPGKTVADYLDQAGGPTRDADKNRIYLLRADGTVVSSQHADYLLFFNSFSSKEMLPGDALIVPEMLDKFQFTKELKDWSQIFYQFAIGVVSLKVLGGL
jgi:protein involved in polysaccharide export with SLBB domain